MRALFFLLTLIPIATWGSDTPISGTFSNANPSFKDYANSSLTEKFNLIVVVNSQGQQFILQCFKNKEAGFTLTTAFKKPTIDATIQAGSFCSEKSYEINLDYNEAYIRSPKGWAQLPRGPIYVPITD